MAKPGERFDLSSIACAHCDVTIELPNGPDARRKFCSPSCKDLARRVPCQFCGVLKHGSAEVRALGYTTCQSCRKERAPHNANRYSKRGCRCDVCTAAKAAEVREYEARTKYWSKPDVVARRKAGRATPEGQAATRKQNQKWYSENKEASRDNWRRREALKLRAVVVKFTVADLDARLSMAGGKCWICKCALPDGFHVDHVKPLSKGGPHMLANLRPACPSCNVSKSDKWPFVA